MNALLNYFKELIGYELHTSRIAFDFEGVEIVFIHDFFILKRRVYINGEPVFSRYTFSLGFFSDSEIDYQGQRFRIITKTKNLLSMEQDVTVWVNGVQAGRKFDRLYGAMPLGKRVHAALGILIFGMILGWTSSSLGSMLRNLFPSSL